MGKAHHRAKGDRWGGLSKGKRVRDGQLPDPSGGQPTGEPCDTERVKHGLERGRWKSTRKGNSLAAYSTAYVRAWVEFDASKIDELERIVYHTYRDTIIAGKVNTA